ncbi:MAG: helix-turn-helix domain-containing protein [Acidobacteriaceae bacterium]|nr:helix-turn-helix domain-containing protein [Acidobacteriaceae bacterium]
MKGSFDIYLEEKLKNPKFREIYEQERRFLNIGIALANQRKKKGLTQEALAKKIGSSAPQVSRTERRPERANVQTLVRYAEAVGMELDLRLVARR